MTISVSPVKYVIAFDKIIGIVKTVIKLAKAVKVTENQKDQYFL